MLSYCYRVGIYSEYSRESKNPSSSILHFSFPFSFLYSLPDYLFLLVSALPGRINLIPSYFVNAFSVSTISLSISGRILSLYFDKSASCKHDSILGIYCGFANPTCARALIHCLAVIGFSSVICARKSVIIVSKRFSSSHRAFAARIYRIRFLTNDFG